MVWEEIETGFAGAGGEVTENRPPRLLVGHSGKLKVLVHGPIVASGDPAFELADCERGLTYWVRVVPTPRQAAVLLEEHGGPPEQERGNPHKR